MELVFGCVSLKEILDVVSHDLDFVAELVWLLARLAGVSFLALDTDLGLVDLVDSLLNG